MPDLSLAKEPLILNMRRLKTLNSYGIRNIIKMVREWGSRKLEFHECPSMFVDSLNVVRSMLGAPPNPERVRSLCVPHYCEKHDETYDILFEIKDIVADNNSIDLPDQHCPDCGEPMELDCALEEYLMFLLDNA